MNPTQLLYGIVAGLYHRSYGCVLAQRNNLHPNRGLHWQMFSLRHGWRLRGAPFPMADSTVFAAADNFHRYIVWRLSRRLSSLGGLFWCFGGFRAAKSKWMSQLSMII